MEISRVKFQGGDFIRPANDIGIMRVCWVDGKLFSELPFV